MFGQTSTPASMDSAPSQVTQPDNLADQIAQSATLTANALSDSAQVQQFQSVLGNLRAGRLSAIASAIASNSQLQNLQSQRSNTISLFMADVINAYPSMSNQTYDQVMSQIQGNLPLYSIWNKYSTSMVACDSQIASTYSTFVDAYMLDQQLQAQENYVFDLYSQFAAQASSSVPTLASIQASLPPADDTSIALPADLSLQVAAIDLLGKSAQALVTRQMAILFACPRVHRPPTDVTCTNRIKPCHGKRSRSVIPSVSQGNAIVSNVSQLSPQAQAVATANSPNFSTGNSTAVPSESSTQIPMTSDASAVVNAVTNVPFSLPGASNGLSVVGVGALAAAMAYLVLGGNK